jgi:phosphohistidine phosphatase
MTQRRLIIVRHAKTEESHPAGDHARTLTERGMRDAAALGEWLQVGALMPDVVLCSTAVRARQTLVHLGHTLATELYEQLYLAEPDAMLQLLAQCDDALKTVMVIGHNPGLHALVVALMHDATHEEDVQQLAQKFPTCTAAVLELSVSHWSELCPHSGTLTHYHVARG